MALLGALDRLAGRNRTKHDIARAAHAVETVHLGRQCGIQDQLCAAFGGVNFIEMTDYPRAIVTPLPLPDPIRRELDRRLALIYLGRPHSSSAVHEKVVKNLERLGPDCAQLDALRVAAERSRDALLAGDLDALGSAMRDNTLAQAELHPELVHDDAWRGDRDCRRSRRVRLEGERCRRRRWIDHGARQRRTGSEASPGARDYHGQTRTGADSIVISRDGLRVW